MPRCRAQVPSFRAITNLDCMRDAWIYLATPSKHVLHSFSFSHSEIEGRMQFRPCHAVWIDTAMLLCLSTPCAFRRAKQNCKVSKKWTGLLTAVPRPPGPAKYGFSTSKQIRAEAQMCTHHRLNLTPIQIPHKIAKICTLQQSKPMQDMQWSILTRASQVICADRRLALLEDPCVLGDK
jgi:hypothetical protein